MLNELWAMSELAEFTEAMADETEEASPTNVEVAAIATVAGVADSLTPLVAAAEPSSSTVTVV